MDNLIEQLNAYVKKFKRNNKLSRANNGECVNILSEFFVRDYTRWREAFQFMINLPAEAATDAYVKAWQSMGESERREFIEQLIEDDNFKKSPGIYREVYLVERFVDISNDITVRLLVDIGVKTTKDCAVMPPLNITSRIKKVLLNQKVNVLTDLPLNKHKINNNEFAAMAILLLMAIYTLTENDTDRKSGIRREVREWLFSEANSTELLGEIERQVLNETGQQENIKTSSENVNLQTEKNNSDRASIQTGKAEETKVTAEKTRQYSKTDGKEPQKEKIANDPNFEKMQEQKSARELTDELSGAELKSKNGVRQFNPIDCLRVLEDIYTEQTSQIKHLNEDLKELKIKLEIEKNKKLSFQEKHSELKKEIEELNIHNENLKKELEKEKKEKNELGEKLVSERAVFEEQLNELLEKDEQESGYRVEEFKNKLVKHLRVEYSDFKEITNDEMTVELGENLRSQLKSIFNILGENGIRF